MHDTGEPSAPSPDRFGCPGCQEEVDVAAEFVGQLVRCPYCNAEFFASHDQSHLPVVDDTSPPALEFDRESAFDKLRIENFTALRMGAIRARSWWIIGCCLCLVAVVDMIAKSAVYVYILHKWGINPTLRAIVAIAMLKLANHSWRRAAEFKREIDQSAIPEPTTPPDFSTLNNGSDQWKNLENVR